MGSVFLDLAATDMQMKLEAEGVSPKDYPISSTTFDNPGAHKQKEICRKRKVSMDYVKDVIEYKAFNNCPNFINTLGKKVGEKN